MGNRTRQRNEEEVFQDCVAGPSKHLQESSFKSIHTRPIHFSPFFLLVFPFLFTIFYYFLMVVSGTWQSSCRPPAQRLMIVESVLVVQPSAPRLMVPLPRLWLWLWCLAAVELLQLILCANCVEGSYHVGHLHFLRAQWSTTAWVWKFKKMKIGAKPGRQRWAAHLRLKWVQPKFYSFEMTPVGEVVSEIE